MLKRLTGHINPNRKRLVVLINTYRHEDTPVEAGAARVKPLQVVDGGQVCLGIVEGEKLTVHAALAARRDAPVPRPVAASWPR